MDKAKLVDGLYREYALCDVEAGDVFGECIVLDEHSHEIAARQELHD